MINSDRILDKAWRQLTEDNIIKLPDLISLFDFIDRIVGRKILSPEYRDFLIELVLESPSSTVDKRGVKELIERLFECEFDDLINGIVSDGMTQTMNLERRGWGSSKVDSSKGQIGELKRRIAELKRMNGSKDIIIDYYDKLVVLLSVSSNYSDNDNGTLSNDEIISRLKQGIDKQDIIIDKLKRKVGNVQTHWQKFLSIVSKLFFSKGVLAFIIGLLFIFVISFEFLESGAEYEFDHYHDL
ncbi:hypothetical protein DAMA08_030830 [Martiniozyma asiatica (nom. inval.)]|nr:hypothetical protein DAMA08_030830 [Martiniozyma asiatica]